MGPLFRRDADPCVANLETDLHAIVALRSQPGPEHHLAALGEFDRVGGQVCKNLAQTERIAAKRRRQIVIDQTGQLQSLGGGIYCHHPGDALDDVV